MVIVFINKFNNSPVCLFTCRFPIKAKKYILRKFILTTVGSELLEPVILLQNALSRGHTQITCLVMELKHSSDLQQFGSHFVVSTVVLLLIIILYPTS